MSFKLAYEAMVSIVVFQTYASHFVLNHPLPPMAFPILPAPAAFLPLLQVVSLCRDSLRAAFPLIDVSSLVQAESANQGDLYMLVP